MSHLTGRVLVALIVLSAAALPLAAEKTDVVIFSNGDRLTGEIKKLERGLLHFKTDAAGTIQIEWDDIAAVKTVHNIEVELRNGERMWGGLESPGGRRLTVLAEDRNLTFDLDEVVFLTPIKETFWKRLDGSIGLGFSYSEADDRTQYSVDSDATYRSRRLYRSLSFDGAQSTQAGVQGTNRWDLNLELIRPLPRRKRSWMAVTSLERNDQLGLDLRGLIGGAAVWFLIQNNSTLLAVSPGLAFSLETPNTGEPNEENIELFLGFGFENFRYDSPTRDIDIKLRVFPGLTQSDRIRVEFDASIRWEVVSDFYFGLNLREAYDSRPVSSVAETNDLSLTTSLGWSF